MFLDYKYLNSDDKFEDEKIENLAKSNCVIFLISTKSMINFSTLSETSPKDHFLYEWTTAIELKRAGVIYSIMPIYVGDVDESDGSYFRFNTYLSIPKCPDKIVKSIDDDLIIQLARMGVSKSASHKLTVEKVVTAINANHGLFLEEISDDCVDIICDKVTKLYCTRALDIFLDTCCFIKDVHPISEILNISDNDNADKFVMRYIYYTILSMNLPNDIQINNNNDSNTNINKQFPKYPNAWQEAVQKENAATVNVIRMILEQFTSNIEMIYKLSNTLDKSGRKCINIATKSVRNMINDFLFLYKRYELKIGTPEHISSTCIIRLAIDHSIRKEVEVHNISSGISTDNSIVALKFMNSYEGYKREIDSRDIGNLDEQYVIGIIDRYDENHIEFRKDAIMKGFQKYSYCVTMAAADQNLKKVIDQQHIAGVDWDAIKFIVKSITLALEHLHSKGFIHGDV